MKAGNEEEEDEDEDEAKKDELIVCGGVQENG